MRLDVLVRYLESRGAKVNYCENVTDIDDDTIREAPKRGTTWRDLGNPRGMDRRIRDTRNLTFGYLPFAEQPGGSGGEGEAAKAFEKVTVRRSFKPVPYYNPSISVGAGSIATTFFNWSAAYPS